MVSPFHLFDAEHKISTGQRVSSLELIDVDADGQQDVLVGGSGQNGSDPRTWLFLPCEN